jgi:uncharacterized protein (DUF305 family)
MRRLAGLLISAVMMAAATAPAGGQHEHGSETKQSDRGLHAAQPKGAEFDRLMQSAMAKMHDEMALANQSDDADRNFLAKMIPHHAGAVEMARLVLIYGKDPLVRQLAEEIIAGQQAEIQAMQSRLKLLQHGPDPEPGGFPALTGMRGD